MIDLNDEQKKFIKENSPTAWNAFVNDDYRILEEELYMFMVENGFDKNDDITDYGRKLEKMCDDVQRQNCV